MLLKDDEWNGTWLHTDGSLIINVLHPERGILQLAWIDGIGDELSLESLTCQIMESERWLYWNILEMGNESSENGYRWGALKKEGRELIIWFPVPETFQKAVTSRLLSGGVIHPSQNDQENSPSPSYQVILHDTPQNIINEVESMGPSSYFSWDEPVFLRKLGE